MNFILCVLSHEVCVITERYLGSLSYQLKKVTFDVPLKKNCSVKIDFYFLGATHKFVV